MSNILNNPLTCELCGKHCTGPEWWQGCPSEGFCICRVCCLEIYGPIVRMSNDPTPRPVPFRRKPSKRIYYIT